MKRLFGTDGVRGIANSELTPEMAFMLGKAGATVIQKGQEGHTVVVGMDTRISGDMLFAALASGIMSVGLNVQNLGIVPTPTVAYVTKHTPGAVAGVVISASHNPFFDNGIKFFDKEGYKLSDEIEDEIEAHIQNGCSQIPTVTGEAIGRMISDNTSALQYVNHLLESVEGDLQGLHFALDTANGATYQLAEKIFTQKGAKVTLIHHQPNGTNINDHCGSTHLESLQKVIQEGDGQYDGGFAYDGDGDRLLAIDEKGDVIDGDGALLALALLLKKKNALSKDTVVATVMSNMGIEIALQQKGLQLVRTAVGDRYIMEAMKEQGYNFGGEPSGHIIMKDIIGTGDGILSSLLFAMMIKEEKVPLSHIHTMMTAMPQVLYNVAVKDKTAYMNNAKVKEAIKETEKAMDGKGRVLIRPSGTEPKIRVMLEGENLDNIDVLAKSLVEIIKKELS